MGWGSDSAITRFVFRGCAYANVDEVIADLPRLVDLDEAVFDWTLMDPILRFVTRMQGGDPVLAVGRQEALLAILRARIEMNRGHRVCPLAAPAIELPRGTIFEIRIQMAGAAFALAELGILSAVREEVAVLCRQVGRNVLALISKRPTALYRIQISTGGPSSTLAQFIVAADLADDFYRVRRTAIEHKRRHVADAVVALRHRLGDRRTLHRIPESERAKAMNLIRVRAPRFCDLTLRDALVA